MHNSNITLAISDQRKHFYQWDTGRKLIVTGLAEGSQIHFHREGMAQPFTLPVYADGSDLFCNVPDELLQKAKSFAAYTYITDKNGNLTRTRKTFTVEDRPKPADYIYTETENYTLEKAIEEALKDVIDGQLDLSTNPAVLELDAKIAGVTDKIEDVESIAKGAGQAVSYGNYSTMIEVLNALPNDIYKVGQSIMIVTVEVPDLWVSAVGEEATEYAYTSDEDFVSAIKANGSVKVGHYQLSQLETQKVDLTEYVKYTDYAGNVIGGEKAGVIGLNYASSCGLHYGYSGNKKFLQIATPDTTALKRRNGRYGLVVGELDSYIKTGITGLKQKQVDGAWVDSYGNQIALTDEEKASALAWLGAVGFNDYATGTKAGVMKVPGNTGVYMYEGKLWLRLATNYEIKNKTNYFAIAPERLDYAMKIGLTTNTETLTDEEKITALKWLGAVSDTGVEYTCSKYNHQALIEGYLADRYGYAASDVLTADALSGYEIDVECDESYGSIKGTLSLAGARVTVLDGGYALSVAPTGVSSSCPDARVIVVTDTEKFNKTCNCDLESVGIYLSNTQVDNDVMQMTYQTKVTALRATTAKISNAHLYLEGHPLIKSLMAKIEALEKKA